MTAQQHHDVQHETPVDQQFAAPDRTDPAGPITVPKRYRIAARAMALFGIVGVSTMAVTVMAPNGLPWVVGG
ncbi:hypothetical protein OHA18_11345 [Kribbella sp. NBC_00709]|uniref:hypothetical protein n=1 Tax=Kribbella sp. NBC_00709 TaxID=2975972 RepID=UPI002E2A2152|nr:hypothetical protein [Kribbella sp. NBC_00709]